MNFFPDENFSNISTIINESQHVLTDLYSASNSIIAFRKQYPPLINYIKSNLKEITDIAFCQKPADSKSAQEFCLNIFCSSVPAFDLYLSTNPQFLMQISNFLKNVQNSTNDGLASFSLIMQCLIQNSDGYILVGIPNRKNLAGKIFDLLGNIAVYSLLYFLTDTGKKYVSEFLDTDIFALYLFKYIDEYPRKVLQLLINLVKTSKSDKKFMDFIVQEDKLTSVYKIATTSKYPYTSSKAFSLLTEICKEMFKDNEYYDEEEEEEDSYYVFEFIIQRISEICRFVQQEPYLLSHSPACQLLISIIPVTRQIPEEIYQTAQKLFEKMFEYPHRSLCHNSCCNLFMAIYEKDKEVFKKIDIRDKIVYAFTKLAGDHNNVFFGHLYKLTRLIQKSKTKFDSECQGWDEYISNVFTKMKKIINSPYGGVLPKDPRRDDFLTTIIIE
ncbi:hypothetical protein M9Y10_023180 [Tritrichomonas musculus]|uniref:Uncharacterized protein n=1 Tax=Tritrichomonas musculus TaxID=1915356 RepID=A0ABR2KUC2_9EUKA